MILDTYLQQLQEGVYDTYYTTAAYKAYESFFQPAGYKMIKKCKTKEGKRILLCEMLLELEADKKYLQWLTKKGKRICKKDDKKCFQYIVKEIKKMNKSILKDMKKINIEKQKKTPTTYSEQLQEAGFEGKPKGWTDKSVKKYSKTFTSQMRGTVKSEGFFDKCVKKMQGKVDNPEGFCAALKDETYGSTGWRGKGKTPAEVNKDVKKTKFKV